MYIVPILENSLEYVDLLSSIFLVQKLLFYILFVFFVGLILKLYIYLGRIILYIFPTPLSRILVSL